MAGSESVSAIFIFVSAIFDFVSAKFQNGSAKFGLFGVEISLWGRQLVRPVLHGCKARYWRGIARSALRGYYPT